MRFLYIGQCSNGTTSEMRATCLRKLLQGWNHEEIDTHIPFYQTHRLFRSFGFRFKRGPLISNVNQHISSNLRQKHYDFVWVDKAILISESTTAELRRRAENIIHYTPDTAFYGNRSTHFYKSMPYYDFLITTKSFEKEHYLNYISEEKLLFTTQGFDKYVHRPFHNFEEKENCVVFIGLWEHAREKVLQALIDNQINVKLSGYKWDKFVARNSTSPYVDYLGETITNDEYAKMISSALFSLGCLSKRFPELHTTRTFEIPACGTALLTERNEETASFFDEDEAIFYDDLDNLINKLRYYEKNLSALKDLTDKGTRKVNDGGFDYTTILTGLLNRILH